MNTCENCRFWNIGRQRGSMSCGAGIINLHHKLSHNLAPKNFSCSKWEPIEPTLKPCPFCGSHAEINECLMTYGMTNYVAQCQNAKCVAKTLYSASKEQAIYAWNQRTTKQ